MDQPSSQRRFTVSALFSPIHVQTSFLREEWPAHVTLAGNFVIEASTRELMLAVRKAGVLARPTVIHFGGEGWFGRNHDVPVRLVSPGRAWNLHRHLADELEQLQGFAADEPGFWRGGYRPHLTLNSNDSSAEESKEVAQIVIAQLHGPRATIAAVFDLPHG